MRIAATAIIPIHEVAQDVVPTTADGSSEQTEVAKPKSTYAVGKSMEAVTVRGLAEVIPMADVYAFNGSDGLSPNGN